MGVLKSYPLCRTHSPFYLMHKFEQSAFDLNKALVVMETISLLISTCSHTASSLVRLSLLSKNNFLETQKTVKCKLTTSSSQLCRILISTNN